MIVKNYILLIIVFAFIKSNAQDLRKYIPFKHQNKWGIIDSSMVEVVKPQFNSIAIFNDFGYAEFDRKVIYNLKTGENFPAFGKYKSTLKFEEGNYNLFTNSEKSILINFEKKDTVNLSLKYSHMYAIDFYDTDPEKQKKTNTLIIAHLSDGKILFLKNKKELNPFISKRFDELHIELIESSNQKIIGLVVRKDGYLYFYNHNLEVIKKIKSPEETRYDLLPNNLTKQLPVFYKMDNVRTSCFTCESVWDDSWELELKDNTSNNSNFYLTYSSRDYYLNSTLDPNFKSEVALNYFYYPTIYKSIRILETNSLFFYESDYMKVEKIMFPKKYLINAAIKK